MSAFLIPDMKPHNTDMNSMANTDVESSSKTIENKATSSFTVTSGSSVEKSTPYDVWGSGPFVTPSNPIPLTTNVSTSATLSNVDGKAITNISNKKLYSCDICNKTLTRRDHLKVHKRIHTGERPFKCPTCGFAFARNDHLVRHIRIHSNQKLFTCDICNKALSRRDHLKVHQRIHSGERPYRCLTCGYAFARNDHLIRHMTSHQPDKMFSCDICSKALSRKDHLKIHKRIHTGERPFKLPANTTHIYHALQMFPAAGLGMSNQSNMNPKITDSSTQGQTTPSHTQPSD
ncbi:zinc finger protein 239 [Octopus bimaculoides]|uniref:zinc finger protein 239 n=1 Tax=Octopus bimaculoides TaxID=37653 RepID=UPI0022E776AB|nr:zinc finger protein 239 [Octopus bimaculoides]